MQKEIQKLISWAIVFFMRRYIGVIVGFIVVTACLIVCSLTGIALLLATALQSN